MPQLHGCLAPPRAGLEPEDLRRDVAGSSGIEQEARDLRVGLGLADLEFVGVVLAKGLGIEPEPRGDVGLGNAMGGHRLALAPLRRVGFVCASPHYDPFRSGATATNVRSSD